MGPIALFDKSFLQSLSADEAVWFDHFFMPIVCPVFYVETLGDLAKTPTDGRTAEEVVKDLANKFPEWAGSPCVSHGEIALSDLLGQHIALRPQIPRHGARPVQSGYVFDRTPEEEAFSRWNAGQFAEVEKIIAQFWRKTLGELDLIAVGREMRSIGFTPKACATLQDVKNLADTLVNGTINPYARLALLIQFLHVPQQYQAGIAQAWQSEGKRTLPEFAPYAAHCLTVEMFFQIALGAGRIGGERPSNRTDVAYLFYLPFAHMFVSSDKLHRNTARLFLRLNQSFVWGPDLKAALKICNEHFLKLPESEREKGISAIAHAPPAGNLVADLWDKFLRKGYRDEPAVKMDPDKERELVNKLKTFSKQPTASGPRVPMDKAEMISVKRQVRRRRGSWWQVPKDLKDDDPEETAAY
jgi:hypothetical protein